MKIGIMGAMTEEVRDLIGLLEEQESTTEAGREYVTGTLQGQQMVIAFSRWGKVASAVTATTLITRFGVEKIIFSGVAGAISKELNIGDIVIGKNLYQHDMDASPLFPKHTIPLVGKSYFTSCDDSATRLTQAARDFVDDIATQIPPSEMETFGIKTPKVVFGDIASGDQFINCEEKIEELAGSLESVQCVEMEGAAVAQVCWEHDIPFAIVRTISDSANTTAPINFAAFIENIAGSYSAGIIKNYLRSL